MVTKKKKPKEQLVVHFADTTNFVELCFILIEKAKRNIAGLALPVEVFEDIDPIFMATAVQECFDREMLFELMNSEFGQGLILGIYLNEKARLDESVEESVGLSAEEEY